MKRAIRTANPEAERCLKVIQKCADVGEHQPVCRCFDDAGHSGPCLSAATIELFGGNPPLEPERCIRDRHVIPHRGCILR